MDRVIKPYGYSWRTRTRPAILAIHRTPESGCLGCGHPLDAAGSPDGSPIAPPADGDLTVCLKCGAVMMFAADGTVRGMSEQEMNELTADTETMNHLAHIVRGVHIVRAGKN